MRSRVKSYWAISLVGIASVAVYVAAFTLPYWLPRTYTLPSLDIIKAGVWVPALGTAFIAGFLALMGLYLIAYRLISRNPTSLRFLLFLAVLFSLCLMWMYPVNAADLFVYDFQGRILVHHRQNPYVHPPVEFESDPELVFVHTPTQPATYGPLWLWLEAAVYWIGRKSRLLRLLLLKAIAIGAHLTNSVLIWLVLKRSSPQQRVRGAFLYAWNPLLLLETAGNGHNDAVMMSFVLLSFCLIQRRRWFWVLPCVMLGALIKYVSLLWVPFFVLLLLRQGERDRHALLGTCLGGLMALVLAGLAYAPVWAGAETFRGLLVQNSNQGLSLPLALILTWEGLLATERLASYGEPLIRGFSWLVLIVVALRHLAGTKSLEKLIRGCFWTGLVYIVGVNLQPQAWYLLWIFPLAVLSSARVPLRICHVLSIALFIPYVPMLWVLASRPAPAGSQVILLGGIVVCIVLVLLLARRMAGRSR